LAQADLEIPPNPKTSGGAMWNILALYGAAQRGHVAGYTADDAGAQDFLVGVLQNVTVMDKSARDSIVTFEKGIGDVAITYENEVLVGRQAGQTYELVLPSSTIQIDNPIAIVDTYVDKHGTRKVAEAFLEFLSLEASRSSPNTACAPDLEGLKRLLNNIRRSKTCSLSPIWSWKEATPPFRDTGVFMKSLLKYKAFKL
jgi:sulfate transport system substrate-binding protein